MSDQFRQDFKALQDLFKRLSSEWTFEKTGKDGVVDVWHTVLGIANDPCVFLYGFPFAEVVVSVHPAFNGKEGWARVFAAVDSIDDMYANIHCPDEPRDKALRRAERARSLLEQINHVPTRAQWEVLAREIGGHHDFA